MSPEMKRSADKYVEQKQVADFHEKTRDREIYDRMMTMTETEILEFMGIPPEQATRRLTLFIKETLDINRRRVMAGVGALTAARIETHSGSDAILVHEGVKQW